MIDIELIKESLPRLYHGTLVTLQIALLACLIGIILGTVLGVFQTRKNVLIKGFANFYAVIFRGTPMLIQIFFMRYGVLPLLGLKISAFWTVVIAIGLNSAAYISQIIKIGILSINKGQIEAAKVLGFSHLQTIRYVLLPQAFRKTLPALANEFITLIKDSSLASTIGVMELFKEGTSIISRTYEPITMYVCIALIYLAITSTLGFVVNVLYKKLNPHVKN